MNKENSYDEIMSDFLKEIQINDVLDIAKLQQLQDLFAKANSVASIITHPDGKPITTPSNFSDLCLKIRKTEIGCTNCTHSDAIIGNYHPSGPIVQKCLSCGLWDAGASITIGGKHIANWMIGQVREEKIDEKSLYEYAELIGIEKQELLNLYLKIPIIPYDKFNDIAQMLYAFANEISENAYQNLKLKIEIAENEKNAKRAQKSEATLQAILKASPDDITISDLNGQILLGSNSAYNMFDVDKSYNIQNHHIGDFIIPEDRELLSDNISLMHKGIFNHAHYRGVKQNGEIFDIEVNGEFIRDENGDPVQMIFIIRDITERIIDHKKLKENENKYRTLYTNSPDAYLIIKDGLFVDCNNASEIMLGRDKSKIIGLNPENLSPEFQPDGRKSKDKSKEMNDIAIKNGSHTFEWVHKKNDGTDLFIEVSLASLLLDEKPAIFTTWRDISVRKKHEKSLYENERSKSILLSNLPGIAYLCKFDKDWTMIFVSDQCYSLTGYPKESLIGNNAISFNELILPQYREYLWNAWSDAVEKGEKLAVEYEILTANNEVKWVWEQGIPIYNNKGKIEALEGLIIDITERKLLENQIKINNIELSKINSEKDKFFSIIAHDLRSPFTSFMGLTQILADELASLTLDEIQSYAESLKKSASSLFFLLENLLEWARVKRGQIPFYPKPINTVTLITNAILAHIETAKQKQITIQHQSPNITCIVDEYMITSTIRNLLSNAIKFTPENGIINITASRINGEVIISVSDNGIGMSNTIKDKLFNIDEQTNRVGTNGEPSSGLGLILCKEFIENHQGKVWVESEEEVGTTFYFSIPSVH